MKIDRINIQKFGSFENFDWNSALQSTEGPLSFSKLNIIYGRNYSGKTTLSRIFRSLETGQLPPKYQSPSYEVYLGDTLVKSANLEEASCTVRVYNKDFVDEQLEFLTSGSGGITPFAILGKENKLVETEIHELNQSLGSEETEAGLLHRLACCEKDFQDKNSALGAAQTDLENKLRNKATSSDHGIKHNSLYKDPNYNTPKLRADIEAIRHGDPRALSDEDTQSLTSLVKQERLDVVDTTWSFRPELTTLLSKANDLLTREIAPSEPIQDLLNNAVLQSWARNGIDLHRGQRSSCGFCGQSLPPDIWEKLDAHFSQESQRLESELGMLKSDCDSEKIGTDRVVFLDKSSIYPNLHDKAASLNSDIADWVQSYKSIIDQIIDALSQRLSDIFSAQEGLNFDFDSSRYPSLHQRLVSIENEHNVISINLSEQQDEAREKLRLSEVAKFIEDIDYAAEELKIEELREKCIEAESTGKSVRTEVEHVYSKLEELATKLKDERQGAEQVNQYLTDFFGHSALKLSYIEAEDESAFKFQVMRGEDIAHNLSEGECSLISFCYFCAKLKDTKTAGKPLIVYIDDPISSLDSNHIFFIYSLIDTLIATPNKTPEGNIYPYEQLFISTHNLEFLKYLRRLKKPPSNSNFLVTNMEGGSKLEVMPDYLSRYVTEFNYLFNEICICSEQSNSGEKHGSFYNFGNNARKFLESYLFFKYPFNNGNGDYNERINRFFGHDSAQASLVQRMTNEYSHLGEAFDRSSIPVDHAEIAKLAKFILSSLKRNDPEQYECLLNSVDQEDPLKS